MFVPKHFTSHHEIVTWVSQKGYYVRFTRVWYMMLQKSGLKFSLKGYLQLGYRSIANHGIMYLSHGTNNYGCFELDIWKNENFNNLHLSR